MRERRPRGPGPSPDWSVAVSLLAIAERGCELHDRAAAVLALAALPATREATLAREGGGLSGEYHRLSAWVDDIAVDAVADPIGHAQQQELSRLLRHHCHVLHHAIRMVFPRHAGPGPTGRISTGLGEPARRLRELAAELRPPA